MIVIRDTSVVPTNGWAYPVQPTNTTIRSYNYSMLYQMILQHCRSNDVIPPTEQEVVAYLCETLSIPCYDEETRTPLVNRFTMGLPNPVRIGGCCS